MVVKIKEIKWFQSCLFLHVIHVEDDSIEVDEIACKRDNCRNYEHRTATYRC